MSPRTARRGLPPNLLITDEQPNSAARQHRFITSPREKSITTTNIFPSLNQPQIYEKTITSYHEVVSSTEDESQVEQVKIKNRRLT